MDKRTQKRKTGDFGEDLACEFLRRKGFEVVERNYLRKWGEIDIVARKGSMWRFIEVKTVSYENFRPEEHLHPWKLQRLSRTIQTYLLQKDIDEEWQLDVITVKINHPARKARVELIENIVI